MASRSETDLLANALNALSSQAQGDIDAILETPDKKGHADGIAAVLLKYGSASGELGASMFDAWAEKLGIEAPKGASGYDLDPDWAKKRVRWALSTKNPRGNLKVLADELVKQPARDALASSAKSNGVRFARVPRGSETCAFCYMLASRGAVYHSEATAGKMTKFHGDCDCQIVPVRGPQDYPDGYDPDTLYDDYLNSRVDREDGSVDVRGTLSQMRLNLHDKLRDGVEPPEVKAARLAPEKPWGQTSEPMAMYDDLRGKTVGRMYGPDKMPLEDAKPYLKPIRLYGSDSYMEINSYLRGTEVDPEDIWGTPMTKDQLEEAVKGLDKTFEDYGVALGDDVVLYRGVNSDGGEDISDRFVEGGVFKDPAYLSTSTDPAQIATFARDGGWEIRIEAKGVNAISMQKLEREILLPRNTELRITKVDRENHKVWAEAVAVKVDQTN